MSNKTFMHTTNYESRTPECSKNRGEKKVPTKKQAILTLLLVSLHTQYAIANTETIRHTITLGFKEVTVTTQTNSQINEFYEHHTNVNSGIVVTPWHLRPTLQGPESSGAFSSISSTKCTKIETKLTSSIGLFHNISDAGHSVGNTSMYSGTDTNYHWYARTSLVTWVTHRGRVEIPARTTLATEKWRCPIGESVRANTPQLKLYFSQAGWPLGSEGTPVRDITNLTTQLSERNTNSLTLNLWAPTFTDSNSKLRLLTGYSGSAKNQYELKLKTSTDGESLLTLTDNSGRKINWQQVLSSDSVYVQTAHRPGKTVIPVTLTITSK
ncbi:hypothetical protein FA806_22080 [Escherichia coli]|nr:hypothetical protein [Escherichia coli]